MAEIDTKNLIEVLQQSFVPKNSVGMDISLQLNLTGDLEEKWVLLIKDQKCSIDPGDFPNPKVHLTLAKKDLLRLISGELDPMVAFFTGRVQLSGDRSAVMKIPGLFNIDPSELKKYI